MSGIRKHKILLVYPEFPRDSFWGFRSALDLAGRRSTMPPLGLLTVASYFPSSEFDVRLIDENVGPATDHDIRSADFVLASAMIVQAESLNTLIDRCLRLETKVIVGGPFISAAYERLISDRKLSQPTTYFIGEAETLFPQVVDDIRQDRLRSAYAHVTTREKASRARNVLGPDSEVLEAPFPSLEESPLPRFDLVPTDAYHSMAVQTSRGCPIGCEFCDIWKQFGRIPRVGSSSRIIHQLDTLYSLGWRGRVFIVDDNFIGNPRSTGDLVPELAAWQKEARTFVLPEEWSDAIDPGRRTALLRDFSKSSHKASPFAFSTEADIRLGSSEPRMSAIREGMVEAGFNSVFLGIETPNEEALEEAKKKINVGRTQSTEDHLLGRVRRIQQAGMEVMAGFIVGFDSDPSDVAEQMVKFVQESQIPVAMISLLTVGPGTALEERLEKEGRYEGRLMGSQTHSLGINFRPKGVDEEEVIRRYLKVLSSLYDGRLESYFERCEGLLSTIKEAPATGDETGFRELWIFLKALWRVRPRWSFWKFLAKRLVRAPRTLPYAVVLGIQGHHLREITQSVLEANKFRVYLRETLAELHRSPNASSTIGGKTTAERTVSSVVGRFHRLDEFGQRATSGMLSELLEASAEKQRAPGYPTPVFVRRELAR